MFSYKLLRRLIYYAFDPLCNNYFAPERNRKIIAEARERVFGTRPLRPVSSAGPEDFLRRSLAQHLCQVALIDSSVKRVFRFVGSGLVILPFAAVALVRRWRSKPGHQESNKLVVLLHYPSFREYVGERSSDAIFIDVLRPTLSLGDIASVFGLLSLVPKTFLYPELVWRLLHAVGIYSTVISRYHPRSLAGFEEHSCASSVVTWYCRMHGVKHINLMHGDRACVAGLAFAAFDEFRVWGEYYVKLFSDLLAAPDQFRITGNPFHRPLFALRKKQMDLPSRHARRFLIFEEWLLETVEYTELLASVLALLGPEWKVVLRSKQYRVHEFLDSSKMVSRLRTRLADGHPGASIELENSNTTAIADSIAAAEVVTGAYTTALLDAWIGGKKVIRLELPSHEFCLPVAPYSGSANVLVVSGDLSKVEEFLRRPVVRTPEEEALLEYVSRSEIGSHSVPEPRVTAAQV